MSTTRTRVLVIEDDPAYARLLRLHLESSNYQVLRVDQGQAGLDALDEFVPEAVILDVVLPDMDGFEVLRRLRERSSVPVIMLTARAEERNKVQGLMSGADDYMTKPFSVPELLARLTTILRRARRREAEPAQTPIAAGDVLIDIGAGRVYRAGEPLAITATEFKLLRALAENSGRVMVTDDLLRRVWGPGYEGDSSLLRTTVGRLRQKLGDGAGELIQNVRGIGYMFETPASGGA